MACWKPHHKNGWFSQKAPWKFPYEISQQPMLLMNPGWLHPSDLAYPGCCAPGIAVPATEAGPASGCWNIGPTAIVGPTASGSWKCVHIYPLVIKHGRKKSPGIHHLFLWSISIAMFDCRVVTFTVATDFGRDSEILRVQLCQEKKHEKRLWAGHVMRLMSCHIPHVHPVEFA